MPPQLLLIYSKAVFFISCSGTLADCLQNAGVLEWHISLVSSPSTPSSPLSPSLPLSLASSLSYYPALEKKREALLHGLENELCLSAADREKRGEERRERRG